MDGTGVRGIRVMTGMTQAGFAEALAVSQSCISDVENGRRTVSRDLRIKIAQVFGTGDDVLAAIQRAKESTKLAL
ncbi:MULTISPECIES: helix-turn-helix transcriptional regulator [Paenibacillus]|uniref:helix-turn-helix transcriptional regulator n=1 Tax=Paenibacillus TaxID=44249 RepID=UPI000722B12C|nr:MULTISPECIES: helix-turn-helix domain-containing protein [Paenibacillus]ALP36346.1 DNA-binding protein [Paenibacillus sp. IHB B 3084]MDY8021722.1 helix-turn-helix domain-containing protein [Paenibacillus polymyxa]UMR38335.1 helix-turn-helix domain-containing protein [Paenibacillus polymyxa]